MKSCTSLLVGVIFGIITFFSSFKTTYARSVFIDDFSYKNTSLWNFETNGGRIDFIDGGIRLSASNGNKFPYITLVNKINSGNSYSINIRFMFSGILNYGNGIVFSNTTPSNNSFQPQDHSNVIFQIWPKTSSIFGINSPLCEFSDAGCGENALEVIPLSSLQSAADNWHDLKINFINGIYNVSIDGESVFTSSQTSLKITDIWFGNYETLSNTALWTNIYIDYLHISNNEDSPTIIIPGLGASWDMAAMLSGSDGSNWEIPSFVKDYEGLKNSFVEAGYSMSGTDRNIFIFPYDWRKPLSVLAGRLDTFIRDNIPPSEKVNLVGHSMGGLVARAYSQEYDASRINQILTIGSPNFGTSKTYGIWEGATVLDDVWWGKVALELTTHFGKISGESDVDTVQRMAPSIKDLLPTFNFLRLGGNLLPWLGLTQKNEYLDGLNQNYSPIDSIATAMFSREIQTHNVIRVITPTSMDLQKEMWIDGKPITNPFELTQGDGTVIESSAKGPFSNTVEGTGWHGELVTKLENIQKIFGVLDLDQSKAVSGDYDSRKNVFVAALRSPGVLEVCNIDLSICNGDLGLYFTDNKLFMLPGYNNEELVVKIKESGLGFYNLHLGNINETTNWSIARGNLTKDGQQDSYIVQGSVMKSPPTYRDQCKEIGWKAYQFFRFKNQGECVSFVERNEKARSKFFWWI